MFSDLSVSTVSLQSLDQQHEQIVPTCTTPKSYYEMKIQIPLSTLSSHPLFSFVLFIFQFSYFPFSFFFNPNVFVTLFDLDKS